MLKVNNLIGFWAGDKSDPFESYVVGQSNFRYVNGTTSYTDDTGKAVTMYNGCQVSGQAAVYDGGNDYIKYTSFSSDFDFGAGDFTFEAFILPLADDSFQSCFSLLPDAQTTGFAALQAGFYSDGRMWLGIGSDNVTSSPGVFSPYDGKVHHIAWVRKAGVGYLCADGFMVHTAALATSVPTPASRLLKIGVATIAGGGAYNNSYKGSILAYRITKDVGRYTSDYQVPNVGNYKFPAI